jgi:LysR family transcriptional regulator, low CO2-responsive transcriptional regulator
MALNLHLLRIFATVAQYESFSRAAEVLFISQPAVFRGVRAFEQQIGLPLIDRSSRTLLLTETGQLLYRHAQEIFVAERAAELALEELYGLARGHLAIGASNTAGTYLLPPLLGAFHRHYPQIRLTLNIGNTEQIVEQLRTIPLDTAFVEGPVDDPDMVVTPWRDDTLVVIAAPDHPLVKQQPVSLSQLAAEPFIIREPGSGTQRVVETALNQRKLEVNPAMELGSNQAVKQAVIAGLGIGIVSRATIGLEAAVGELVILDAPELVVQRVLAQVTIAGRLPSRALIAFQALLAELPRP